MVLPNKINALNISPQTKAAASQMSGILNKTYHKFITKTLKELILYGCVEYGKFPRLFIVCYVPDWWFKASGHRKTTRLYVSKEHILIWLI